jgi:phosphate starvation-inducible PhoH-like protein
MPTPERIFEVEFADNRLLPILFGERDRYLRRIEDSLKITLSARGNRVLIQGDERAAAVAQTVLNRLYERLKQGLVVSAAEVDAALRMAAYLPLNGIEGSPEGYQELSIATRRKVISPRSPGQVEYLNLLRKHELVFGIGPAGTGKTYLAVATAVSMLLSGQVKRLILSRPAVEAGEKLGFLPGDIREKVDPYLRPLYDALYDMLPDDSLAKRFESGEIEVAPLAFMRGRTLSHAYIILDEAQNTTEAQMKMFLTRLGEGSRMVVTGDMTQIDLPAGVQSGLRHATMALQNVDGIGLCQLNNRDVVRHPLVGRIVAAYDAYELAQKNTTLEK